MCGGLGSEVGGPAQAKQSPNSLFLKNLPLTPFGSRIYSPTLGSNPPKSLSFKNLAKNYFTFSRSQILRSTFAQRQHGNLHPRRHQMPQTPAHAEPISAVLKVAFVDLFALQKFGAMESQTLQLGLQLRRIEEE